MAHVMLVHGGVDLTSAVITKESTQNLSYHIVDAVSDIEALTAVDAVKPAAIGVLVYDRIKLKHIECDAYDAEVSYIHPDKQDNKEAQDNDEPQISMSTGGSTKHITHSYETLRSYPDNAHKDIHSNAIGVERTSKGQIKITGTDVPIPSLKLTISAKIPQPGDPFEFGRTLSRCTGRTNNAGWRGFVRGELLLLGAKLTGKKREKWTLDYEFDCSEEIIEADNFSIGGFGPIRKEGHAHLWVEWKQGFGGGSDDPKPTAIVGSVYIERIYHEFNLADLGL